MKIFAKDLVRIKKSIEKFEVAKANLQGIQIQLMTASGQEAITSSIKGACEAYRALNGLMDPKAMQRIMAEYQKESMRQEIMSEVMDGAMDDAMGNLNDPDAEEELVEKTLQEIGVSASGQLMDPSGTNPNPVSAEANADLTSRLNNL